VFVIKDGKALMRRVVVGQRVGSLWVVTQGLERGERVIVDNLQKMREGTPVEVTDVPAEAAPAAAPGGPAAAPANSKGH